MNAIPIDADGNVGEPRMLSPKGAATALVLVAALGLAGLGAYWLGTAPPDDPAAVAPVSKAAPDDTPAPTPEAETLLTAPAATCVDGRPAREDVPPDACT